MNSNKKRRNIDVFTIAEDIFEKLKILGFMDNFCANFNFKNFHKYYFVLEQIDDSNKNQYDYYSEVILWIIHLIENVNLFLLKFYYYHF